jgi:hypothetical protein
MKFCSIFPSVVGQFYLDLSAKWEISFSALRFLVSNSSTCCETWWFLVCSAAAFSLSALHFLVSTSAAFCTALFFLGVSATQSSLAALHLFIAAS